jgi:hypothetical protein
VKIGILCNLYGFPNYLDRVLTPWLDFKDEFIFAAASVKFDQYININYIKEDATTKELLKTKYSNLISYIYSDEVSNDSIVRNKPLEYLIKQGVDYIWLLDGDEFYTKQEILNIKNFVLNQEFICWFRLNFKNYFNNEYTWIDGFCPPRIFKTNFNKLKIDSFYFENDINYSDGNSLIDYKKLSNLEIPKNLAHIKHYSWCGDKEFLRNKVKYQNFRYNGICSYKWNISEEKLELNDDFYKNYNIPKPTIHKEINF